MADILDEVERDYRAEQIGALMRRTAWPAAAALLVLLAAFGLWQLWQARQTRTTNAAALAYIAQAHTADTLVDGDIPAHLAAANRFGALAPTLPAGYRTLARLRQAALLADAGNLPAAQTQWDRIASDPDTNPLLRQLASLLWIQRGLDTADPAALRTRLVSLTGSDSAFNALAREAQALLDMRTGQPDAARTLLRHLTTDPTAPQGVRQRDAALLARLGS